MNNNPKRTIAQEFLSKLDASLKILIVKLNKIRFQKIPDRIHEQEHKKEVYAAAVDLVKSMGEVYGVEKDPFLREVFKAFNKKVADAIKTLVFFIYTDKFKDHERTQQAIQWYWKQVKADMVDLILAISSHYESELMQESQDVGFQSPLPTHEDLKEEDTKHDADKEASEQEEHSEPSLVVEIQKEKKKRQRRKATDNQMSLSDILVAETNISIPDSKVISFPKQESEEKEGNENYTLTGQEYSGGVKTKCQNNLQAIKLLKMLELDQRQATPKEMEILSKYCGWGGMPQVFMDERWKEESLELKAILTEEEYRDARASTLNAFYTDAGIIQFVYDALDKMGYTGGKVLDPSCGTGNYFGCYKKEWAGETTMYGVELDGITGRIARQLYPQANILIKGFEETQYPAMFDLVVSNIPFGDYKVHDAKYNKLNLNIHDYFFCKAMDVVKPGGVIAFITSKGTMDKVDSSFRQYMAERANLIGAVRLPNNAFKSANTEVTTDIIFLQKKDSGSSDNGIMWMDVKDDANGVPQNEYFISHPEMLMGTMDIWQKMFGRDNTTLMPNKDKTLEEQLQNVIPLFPTNVFPKQTIQSSGTSASQDTSIPAWKYPDVKEFAYAKIQGNIYQREGEDLKRVTCSGKKLERLQAQVEIKETLVELINLQMDDQPEIQIQALQTELNNRYDQFVLKYGYLTDKVNKDVFREDPQSVLVNSLEKVVDGKVTKADIFYKRTIVPVKKIRSCGNAEEALTVSLHETTKVDFPLMESLTGKTELELITELKGKIFYDPSLKRWVPAEEYLSGNVVLKKDIVTLYVENDTNSPYIENLEALKLVQPEVVKAEDIEVRLGAPWVSEFDIWDFIVKLLNITGADTKRLTVQYIQGASTWKVYADQLTYTYRVASSQTWGTGRVNAFKLIEQALNMKQPSVYDTVGYESVFNKNETIAARAKQDSIKVEFQKWLFRDADRRRRLTQVYNEKFNNIRLREFDGSKLTLPGINPAVKLEPHQLKAIYRGLHTPNCLLAHAVGAGKSFEMASLCMELKRVGLAQKSMIVVPNQLTEQMGREIMTLYPTAKVLIATKADFEKDNRKRFISRIAVETWDAVVLGHSMLKKIPVLKETLEKSIQGEIDQLIETISSIKTKNRQDARLIKQLEKMVKNLEGDMASIYDTRRDDTLCFEQLGVDQLFIDEADCFKNLGVITKMQNIAGVSTTRSQKAFDLYIKMQYIQEKRNGGGVVFATGTPISNSMVEMYNLMRYLAKDKLIATGLINFDAWAATFGEIIAAMEIAPDGSGYRVKQRFSKFFNLPELLSIFREFTDIQTPEMLNLPVPKLKGGKPVVVAVEATTELKEIIKVLVERSEAIQTRKVDPKDDNMLVVTSDGRKAALDTRLICNTIPDHPDLKVNTAAQNIYQIWNDTHAIKGTQLVFCDTSTPGNGTTFDIYNELKGKLVMMGIPDNEIAFMQMANTDDRKIKLFDKVNAGIVRVLIGSTETMGAGTNVQDRMYALHHLDCPWRPRDVQQREGRILRRGNKNPEVMIFRYVTKESFDAYMWQTVENKAKFISQVMNGQTTARAAEDIDSNSLSYAEVKAIASGNPMILELMEVNTEIQKLQILRSAFKANTFRMQDDAARIPGYMKTLESTIDAIQKDIHKRDKVKISAFEMEIEGVIYTDVKDASAKLNLIMQEMKVNTKFTGQPTKILVGQYNGFDMELHYKRVYFGDDEEYVILKGETDHKTQYSIIPAVLQRHLDTRIFEFETNLSVAKATLQKNVKELADLQVELQKPFEYEERLKALTIRQNELNHILDKSKTTEVVDAEEAV